MEKIDWRTLDIKPHQILVTVTSPPDYEMWRMILLEVCFREYVILEGWHCSCFDFDDTEWEAIKYSREELIKLGDAGYNDKSNFWELVKEQLYR